MSELKTVAVIVRRKRRRESHTWVAAPIVRRRSSRARREAAERVFDVRRQSFPVRAVKRACDLSAMRVSSTRGSRHLKPPRCC